MIPLRFEVLRFAAESFLAEVPSAKVSARVLLRWASCWASQRKFQENSRSMKHAERKFQEQPPTSVTTQLRSLDLVVGTTHLKCYNADGENTNQSKVLEPKVISA